MNKKIMLTVAAVVFFPLMGNLSAEEAAKQNPQDKKIQTMCPVQGEEINKTLFVDYKGKRIYVCCNDCIEIVKADPEKYVKEIEAKGIVLESTPKDKASAVTPKTEKKGASCH